MEDNVDSSLNLESLELKDLDDVAGKIVDYAKEITFWLFEGEMGAGKTTLIKSLCKQLNVLDVVSSPTYSIVNEYRAASGEVVYHFDFYRLNSEEEALDIGVDEYFDSNHYCFLEWSSKVASLLPSDQYLLISIRLESDNQRSIEVTRHD